jgi:Na+/proline symporter/nitrogen-specific signal transduction histidine kinase
MLQEGVVLLVSFAYLALLFAIAYYGDKRADQGRSIIANPYIYTLSIAVYCTAWTFYGSVGRAASTGIGFLPIYLGPTLMAALWWFGVRKIIRISRAHRITSIADFIASRYGKSQLLAGLVTVIAVVAIMPYIALQLKAVSTSFAVLLASSETYLHPVGSATPVWADSAFYIALVLGIFTILFGTRHIETTERHEGMVAAIAFESLVKLLAFLIVGVFVTFVLFEGPRELFGRAMEHPELARIMSGEMMPGGVVSWMALTFLAMMAILFLPRQYQVLVVENVNEDHLRKAAWLFPLYLLVINLFVLSIAIGGLLLFPDGSVDPDTFILSLPLARDMQLLALIVFLGGLSAATGMVIVETIALATMICNDLVMPALLRIRALRLYERADLSRLLIAIRRWSIVVVILLGYLYFRLISEAFALVTIGLMSFAAVAQFAPAFLLGLYWKGATRRGALVGLCAGFLMWVYTLMVPAFAVSGWIAAGVVEQGPFGIALLRPQELFGLSGLDPITHSVFWSMLVNIGGVVGVSLFGRQSTIERIQATLFVDVFSQAERGSASLYRGTASVADLREILSRFVGGVRAKEAFAAYARTRGTSLDARANADADLVSFAERLLAGAIGAASARVAISSVVKGEDLRLEEVMKILDEASQVIEYSRRLEQKSAELESATAELKAANERLKQLDRLKDEFLSTVTHELRTPLTSIRASSEILTAHPDLELARRQEFLRVIVKESERLTRLINQVLDLARLEAGHLEWNLELLDLRGAVQEAVAATAQLFEERRVELRTTLPEHPALVRADRDQLMQVVINLLSNAVKFCEPGHGEVQVQVGDAPGGYRVQVHDDGAGIPPEELPRIFDKFHQVNDRRSGKPQGTGLGLPISLRIIEHHGGRIWAESRPGEGTTLSFTLPMAEVPEPSRKLQDTR